MLTAFTNLWFITGSWLYFYRLFMSDHHIGVLSGLVFAVGLVAEIPSGALADILGRKRQMLLGLALMSAGFITQGVAHAYWHILLGMALYAVGIALVSGADDALVYDSLDAEGKSSMWRHIIARKFQVMHAVTIASYGVGGILYALHFRLPFVLAGVGIAVGFFITWGFTEVRPPRKKLSVAAYARQNLEGVRYLFHRPMWLYAFVALVVLGVGYAFDIGVIKPLVLDAFGFKEHWQAVINTVAGLLAIGALSRLNWLRGILGEKRGLMVLGGLMALGFLLASLHWAAIGLLAFVAILSVNSLVEPWLNDVVQHRVPSSHRATALSALALLQKIPYVVLVPLAGTLSAQGNFSLFLVGVGLAIALALALLLALGALARRARKRRIIIAAAEA